MVPGVPWRTPLTQVEVADKAKLSFPDGQLARQHKMAPDTPPGVRKTNQKMTNNNQPMAKDAEASEWQKVDGAPNGGGEGTDQAVGDLCHPSYSPSHTVAKLDSTTVAKGTW